MSLTLTSFIATLFKWMPLVSIVHYFEEKHQFLFA